MDYATTVLTEARRAGLGFYTAGQVAPQIPVLYDFEPARYGIPVARFGDAPGLQNWRFIPGELVQSLQWDQKSGGYLYALADIVGNASLIKSGRLFLLPPEYAAQLAKTDWNGNVDLSALKNPAVGYLLTVDELSALYGLGKDAGRPEAAFAGDPGNPYAAWPNQLHNVGNIKSLVGAQVRPMTQAMRSFLLDRGVGDYELMSQTNGNGQKFGPAEWAMYPAAKAARDAWVKVYQDADWYAVDPDNAYNIVVGDTETGYITKTHPLMTDAGVQQLYGHLESVNQGAGDDGLTGIAGIFTSAVLGWVGGAIIGDLLTAESLGADMAGADMFGEGTVGATADWGAIGPESLASGLDISTVADTVQLETAAEIGASVEETTVSMTATEGASTVEETILDWYSVDPGPDPFATTDMVNAGWSFDGGYAGVDWYNSAGIGEAAASNSLDSILGSINKVSSAVNLGIRALSGTAAQVRNNLATPAPNYTRAAGSINLGLLAVGLLAWKLL